MDMFFPKGSIAAVLLITTLSYLLDQVFGLPYPPRRKLEPRFLPTPTNITVHQGELAELKCHIKDLGPKIVVWRKKGEDPPLTIGADTFTEEDEMSIDVSKISEEESYWDLLIKDVRSRHAGTYLCQVTASKLYTHYVSLHVLDVSKISEESSYWDLLIKDARSRHAGTYLCQVTASKLYTHYVSLHVLDEPVRVEPDIILSGTQYVNQGNMINLTCNATGGIRAPLDVDWFFKGERILTTHAKWKDRTQILKRKIGRYYVSDLIVERSTRNDQGNYVCRSTDLSNLKVTSISVHVLSAGKDNVSRRVSGNLSHSKDSSRSSCSSIPSSILTVYLLCVLSLLTS